MNNIWSDNIQGIKTLYLSRKLRFDDFFHGQYESLFSLDKSRKIRILEIGCGPGAVSKKRYQAAILTGVNATVLILLLICRRKIRKSPPGSSQ